MARVSAGTVTLSWTAPTSGAPVTGYRLWRQPGEEALAPLGSDLAATALTYTDSAVTASTTYLYRVQALAAGGPGARTATVSAVLPPAAPTDTLARVAGLPDSYSLWRFQTRARNAGGESAWSGTHFSVRRAGPYRPAAPTGLSRQSAGSGTVTLTWDAVTGATGYLLQAQFAFGHRLLWLDLPFFGVTATFTAASAVVAGLDTSYAAWSCRVQATNAQGDSLASLPLTVANPDA